MELHEEPAIYEKYITENKGNQIRLVVNTFRGVEYISLRRYYMDFSGEWMPSSEGVTFPIDLDSTKELFTGIAEIISLAESRDVIENYFGDLIKDIYVN